MALILSGARFVDGILTPAARREERKAA